MRIERLGEFGFIDRIKSMSPRNRRALMGIGDDCAVIPFSRDKYMLLTQDMLIDRHHFTAANTAGRFIGHKALAASLSDIAAMAGSPRFYMVSLGIPKKMSMQFLDGFYNGMKALARKFRVELIGGDTNRSEVFCCDILVVGEVEKRRMVLRDGARPGDVIYVTGELGGSRGKKEFTFVPRVSAARRLVRHFKVTSMIDVSDGLSSDMNRIAESSRVGALVFEKDLPLSKRAKSVNEALTDGEDFELLFTVRDGKNVTDKGLSRVAGVPVMRIGRIVAKKEGVSIIGSTGRKRGLLPKGFDHFKT